ncbi:hypothetical protein [Powai lake megavirus]|uniref:Uncharacterized protein n=1 Tax=Powai lake megavirus TaxID=1842663 RepID=A0A160ERV2_9VIRU|nr:hypothetical protein QJ849_gp892 [Powai lake megavirus]ANB51054.1 hypothetical protein [Powai lake megavirus]
MDLLQAFISQDPDNNFFHYLNEGDNGTKYSLTNQFILLEKMWKMPLSSLYLFTKMYDNRLWEFPTNELCEGLIYLFRELDITKINELAAGNGLLSARLKHYTNKLDYDLKISTSDGTLKQFGDHHFTYTNVEPLNIYTYNKSEPIIISWIHSLFENELLFSIKNYQQDYIFLIGQHPDHNDYGNNHSIYFHRNILSCGYDFIIIPFKQISQMDYYSYDYLRNNIFIDNKTCVTLYYRKDIELDVTIIVESLQKNNSDLFGSYLNKNKEYYAQDKQLLEVTNKIIDNYKQNNFIDLDPIIITGLKKYLSIKSRNDYRQSASAFLLPVENNLIHILDPYWCVPKIEQVVGRAIRIHSHKNIIYHNKNINDKCTQVIKHLDKLFLKITKCHTNKSKSSPIDKPFGKHFYFNDKIIKEKYYNPKPSKKMIREKYHNPKLSRKIYRH